MDILYQIVEELGAHVDWKPFELRVCIEAKTGNDQILSEALVTASLQKKTAGLNEGRGPGWEAWEMEKYDLMGHVGFTGTGLWLAPRHDFYCIVLTNRVHPSRERSAQAIRAIRRNVLQLACAAPLSTVRGVKPSSVRYNCIGSRSENCVRAPGCVCIASIRG